MIKKIVNDVIKNLGLCIVDITNSHVKIDTIKDIREYNSNSKY